MQRFAEVVPPDEIGSEQATRILDRMHRIIVAMREAGRPIVGLAAPQIGEPSQIILVPRHRDYTDDKYGDFMPVFNPSVVVDERSPRTVVPHGCFSSNETFVRLPSASALTLSGLDRHSEPLTFQRRGSEAVVDEHEVRHLHGLRAADLAVAEDLQIDWRPPEERGRYREYFESWQANPAVGEWPDAYPHDQWVAVRAGEFRLEDYYDS